MNAKRLLIKEGMTKKDEVWRFNRIVAILEYLVENLEDMDDKETRSRVRDRINIMVNESLSDVSYFL